MSKEELQIVIEGIASLPTLPQVASRLVHLLSDPESSMDSIVETISKDPATAAKVLRLTNSAYYGIPKEVSSIRQAVGLLGMRTTRNLALGISVMKIFGRQGSAQGFDFEGFWRHSLGSAYLCAMIARATDLADSDTMFVIGLLHDIGKIVVARYLPERMGEIISKAKAESIPIWEAEQAVLGTTHAEVGAWLGERWNLPESMVQAIRLCHNEKAMSSNVPVAICELANYICEVKGLGSGSDFHEPRLNKAVWSTLGMDAARLKEFMAAVDRELEAAEVFLQQA